VAIVLVQILQTSAKLTITLLTFGIAIGSMPAFAEPLSKIQPLVIPTGTAGDLQGTQQQTTAKLLGGTGGEYADGAIAENLPFYEKPTSAFIQRTITINRHWRNVESTPRSPGEPFSSFRIPVTSLSQ
jgi:hypothetical protein